MRALTVSQNTKDDQLKKPQLFVQLLEKEKEGNEFQEQTQETPEKKL